jgi:hypothetical protein
LALLQQLEPEKMALGIQQPGIIQVVQAMAPAAGSRTRGHEKATIGSVTLRLCPIYNQKSVGHRWPDHNEQPWSCFTHRDWRCDGHHEFDNPQFDDLQQSDHGEQFVSLWDSYCF